MFDRAKTVHSLDRAATVIGTNLPLPYLNKVQHVLSVPQFWFEIDDDVYRD
jgi:hypothetical protein